MDLIPPKGNQKILGRFYFRVRRENAAELIPRADTDTAVLAASCMCTHLQPAASHDIGN